MPVGVVHTVLNPKGTPYAGPALRTDGAGAFFSCAGVSAKS